MQGQFRTHISFDAREVSLQQLAGLWSTAMACLPEVGRCTATFKRRGPSTEHEYIYDDADELARAGIEAKPGELRLRSIHIYSPDATVDIEERYTTGFFKTLLTLPNTLGVTLSGSNERAVLALRTAIEQWGERNLEPDQSGSELREPRWPRLVGDCEPDFVWKLGTDFVYAKRRKQADDGMGNAGAYRRHRVVFRRIFTRKSVQTASDPFNRARLHQALELVVGDPQLIDLARTKEDTETGLVKEILVELNGRHFPINVGSSAWNADIILNITELSTENVGIEDIVADIFSTTTRRGFRRSKRNNVAFLK